MPLGYLLLCAAIAAVWLPTSEPSRRVWCLVLLLLGAVGATWAQGFIDARALISIGLLILLAWVALRARYPAAAALATAATLLFGVAMAMHLTPGFHNMPYSVQMSRSEPAVTKYLNFDKAVAGLVILVMLSRLKSQPLSWPDTFRRAWPIVATTLVGVPLLAIALGIATPEFKFPDNALLFLAANLFFVCVAEEAVFRGLIQNSLAKPMGSALDHWKSWLPVMASASTFALAHAAGGARLVAVAALAGLGYSLVYARTQRIEISILLHFITNAVVFLSLNTVF